VSAANGDGRRYCSSRRLAFTGGYATAVPLSLPGNAGDSRTTSTLASGVGAILIPFIAG
jgi:hypothetical protein